MVLSRSTSKSYNSIIVSLFTTLFIGCNNADSPSDGDGPVDSDTGVDAGDSKTDTESDRLGSNTDVWTNPVTEDSITEVERDEIGVVPFHQETVLEYHLFMNPSLYEKMQYNGNDEVYREASLRVRGPNVEEDYVKIGLRYKGDYSLHHCWETGKRRFTAECAKLSMKIKFNEYDEEGRFYGLKKINLHAMAEDQTKLRERLVYSIFNEFGVKTARTAHAKLYINDEGPFLVLAAEQLDGRFTAYHYPENGDGNLYKETWPTADLSEAELIPQLRTNNGEEDTPDVSRFIAFGNVVADATEDSFLSDMADWVTMDNLLRYMAVDRAIKNWDGITAFYWRERPHNNYWYFDEGGTNSYYLIPWDHDKTLWEYDPYVEADKYNGAVPVPNWNVRPLSCDYVPVWYGSVGVIPPGCDNLINMLAATGFDDFAEYGKELLNTSMQYDAMNKKVTTWAEQIADDVEKDPLLNAPSWEAGVEDLREILKKSIVDFEAHLEEGYIQEQE